MDTVAVLMVLMGRPSHCGLAGGGEYGLPKSTSLVRGALLLGRPASSHRGRQLGLTRARRKHSRQ